MSVLAAFPRHRPSHSIVASPIRAYLNSLPPLGATQTRHYAKQGVITKQGRQGFRGGKKDGGQGGGPMQPVKKEKRLAAFRPMPTAQLSHAVFESDRRDELILPTFQPELLTKKSVGKAMKFPANEKEPFRIFGVPKNLFVEFRILSKPCTVIRDVTVSTIDTLAKASKRSSLDTRRVMTGPPGCGKSTLLLQTVEYCVSSGWIVLYVPRAINLVNSTTTYIYDPRTQTYLQPRFAHQTLQRLLDVNAKALGSLRTTQSIPIERKPAVPIGTSLPDLINMALKDQSIAPTILSSLLAELGKQEQYPVLLAVDDFQALYSKSAYRDPHFHLIKSHHLSMPRLFLEYASGKKSFKRGAFLGAISTPNTTFQLPVELREALGLPHDRPTGPYVMRSPELVEYTQGLQALSVPEKLSIIEAASLFEVWMQDKALSALPNDEVFLSKYSEASGNARSFVWKGMLGSLES